MKNVTKRKDGRYVYRKQIKQNTITIYAKTKEELKIKLKEINLIKTITRKPKANRTLLDWLVEWKNTYKDNFISKSTQHSINTTIKKIESSNLKDIDLTKINTKILQEYLNSIPKSRNKEIHYLYLNACLKKAVNLKLIPENPFDQVIKDKKIKTIRKAFTFTEQKIIFENIQNTDIFAPIFVYLFCGIRKNELSKTIFNDIQEDGTLKVKCEKKRDNEVYRYIDITPKIKNIILENKSQFQWTTKTIYKKFKQFLEDNNIEDGNLHKLRHTFTTNHLYIGTPDKFIQSWLGHEDISVTKNNYMNIDRSLSKEKLLNLYKDYYYIIK